MGLVELHTLVFGGSCKVNRHSSRAKFGPAHGVGGRDGAVQYRLALLDFIDGDIPRAALGFRRAFEAARGDGEVGAQGQLLSFFVCRSKLGDIRLWVGSRRDIFSPLETLREGQPTLSLSISK